MSRDQGWVPFAWARGSREAELREEAAWREAADRYRARMAAEARHFGEDGAAHHRWKRCPCGCEGEPGALASLGLGMRPDAPGLDGLGGQAPVRNPYDALAQLNAARHDPLTAYEEARAVAADELSGPAARDGRDAALELRRFRNPDGGNLSGSAAREIIRRTEFRAEQP